MREKQTLKRSTGFPQRLFGKSPEDDHESIEVRVGGEKDRKVPADSDGFEEGGHLNHERPTLSSLKDHLRSGAALQNMNKGTNPILKRLNSKVRFCPPFPCNRGMRNIC